MSAEAAPARDPRATYRIQLHPGFTFADLEAQAAYLEQLGVSHVYLSPILESTPGSMHGYDVVDHRRVREALGGAEGYGALGKTLGRHALGQILDIVPNHMAVGPRNPWWWDVLQNGPASRYAGWFDVDWEHPEANLRDRILLPVLGDHYGRVLEAGDLRLEWDGSDFTIRYFDDRFPVAPRSLPEILGRAAERAGSEELAFIAGAYDALPPSSATDPESVERRHRDKEVLRRRLAELATDTPAVREAIEAVVAATDTDVEALHALLERQNYRLAWWRSARRDLGYRRFFDVTTLVALRAEDERVFEATHRVVLDWLAAGVIDGLRVDHPDGLRDPEAYFRRLRWTGPRAWIVAEKILEPGEELRRSWPVDGTTGYDFAIRVERVLLDPAGEAPLTDLYERFTGDDRSWDAVAKASKRDVLRDVLGSELARLTALLLDVLEHHRRHRDHTRHDLHEALRAVLVAFPVYRTYVDLAPREDGRPPSVTPEDEAAILRAVAEATEARPELPADLLTTVGDLLLLRLGAGDAEREFVARFQQLTGPVMAKGIEDTAFYRYLRLVALNEVGGDPGLWGMSVAAWHDTERTTFSRWPATMLTTSTHDTKRSGDIRARLLVLAEIPDRWAEAVDRWTRMSERYRSADVPDRATQYLAYQTIVGAWPIEADRLTAYLEKATREAKRHTSWTEPSEAYESGVRAYAEAVLGDAELRGDFDGFVRGILRPGRVNSLAQTLLKLTSPGVPDLYQGTELWDLSLVDPDNRRPVDYGLRRALLERVEACPAREAAELLDDPDEPGLPKLWLIRRALALRARRPEAFGRDGAYVPLEAAGPVAAGAPGGGSSDGGPARAGTSAGEEQDRARWLGFTRGGSVAVIVPRLTATLDGWGDAAVELPPGQWRDVLAEEPRGPGGPTRLADLFAAFPVALLERSDA